MPGSRLSFATTRSHWLFRYVRTRHWMPLTGNQWLRLCMRRLGWMLTFVLAIQLAELGSHHHDLLLQDNDCPACQLSILLPDHATTPTVSMPLVQLFQLYVVMPTALAIQTAPTVKQLWPQAHAPPDIVRD